MNQGKQVVVIGLVALVLAVAVLATTIERYRAVRRTAVGGRAAFVVVPPDNRCKVIITYEEQLVDEQLVDEHPFSATINGCL